jgi:outer membrane protein assembly factor BamB
MNGSAYALDASTGGLLWSSQEPDAIYSSPIVVNGLLYVGSDDGSVSAFGLLSPP